MYLYYFSLINDTFKKYKRKINSLNIDYNFYNIIKKRFKKYMKKKKEYYKEIINNYSKKFNFVLFDNNFVTGENLGNSFQNEINDYEFTKVYDYVEILIRYEKIYKNKIMNNYKYSRIKNNIIIYFLILIIVLRNLFIFIMFKN